ncbi:glycine receptor subunit alpha-2 [Caerostris darwini]|uniref:Glycine receptor subunit alpha-2 n=1 Tax=Caerostris darwini TaxID=1538125 RepID=A0AAV4WKC7_9ARAC|nr:glycine receptor subunit alpha-2 [Caerostris darwini]
MSCFKEFLCMNFLVFFIVRGEEETREILFSDVAPKNYDYLRPPTVNDTPVEVTINIKDANIRSIDESDMSFSVAIELWQSWSDYRLTYPAWAKRNYQILDYHWIDKLWTPNLYFVNAVEGKLNNIITPSSFFWLSKDRKIYYCCRLILKLVCEMNLVHFPHDEQQCGVKMASENVSCLEESVVLRRRGGYYLINVYIPTILIVVMSMLTFWIPYDAVPARITLGVTSLLTIITKQYQASLPNVSYIVALNIWLSCCIGFVFFSLLEFAAVIALSTKKKKKPTSLFRDSSDLILPMVLLKANGTWSTKQCWSNLKEKEEGSGPRRLDFFSRLFFPSFFLIFCIAYWRYYS